MRANNFCIEPYAAEGEYVTLAFNSTGASLLGWFCNEILKPEKAGSAFAMMERECPPGPTGLYVLPHFAGSGTPCMDPFSTGAVLGLRLNTTRGELYKACMEGLCFEMKINAELLERMGTVITGIACAGGGSRSDTLLQVKADIMGIPVKRLRNEESGTTALAMLCATACGDYGSLGDAAHKLVAFDRRFEPDAANHRRYCEKLAVYRQIYPCVSSLRKEA